MHNRWLRIGLRVLFALSLLLNVAVLGYVLQLRNLAHEVGFENARIPYDVRQDYLDRAREDEALLTQVRRLGEARRALNAVADASPYDAAQVAEIMEDIRSITADLQIASQGVLAESFLAVAAREGRLEK